MASSRMVVQVISAADIAVVRPTAKKASRRPTDLDGGLYNRERAVPKGGDKGMARTLMMGVRPAKMQTNVY
jgi:hypothetical protein